MLHIIVGIAISVGVLCLVLANDDARYLLGQLIKIVLGLAAVALCLAVIAVIFINVAFH